MRDIGMGMDPLSMVARVARASEQGPPQVYSAPLWNPLLTRMGYISGYNNQMQFDRRAKGMKHNVQQTMRPHILHGIAPSLETLAQTTLREVATKVNHIHDDRVLFVKTTYSAYRIVGTNVLVEDSRRDCIMLSLYNFIHDEQLDEVLPVGTYMALLAPYMKNSQDNRSAPLMLRCDNPQCVVVFDTYDEWKAAKAKKPRPPEKEDPSTLKQQGNEAFQ